MYIYIYANHLVLEEEYMVTQMLGELPIQNGHWSLQNFISHWTKLWQDGETIYTSKTPSPLPIDLYGSGNKLTRAW